MERRDTAGSKQGDASPAMKVVGFRVEGISPSPRQDSVLGNLSQSGGADGGPAPIMILPPQVKPVDMSPRRSSGAVVAAAAAAAISAAADEAAAKLPRAHHPTHPPPHPRRPPSSQEVPAPPRAAEPAHADSAAASGSVSPLLPGASAPFSLDETAARPRPVAAVAAAAAAAATAGASATAPIEAASRGAAPTGDASGAVASPNLGDVADAPADPPPGSSPSTELSPTLPSESVLGAVALADGAAAAVAATPGATAAAVQAAARVVAGHGPRATPAPGGAGAGPATAAPPSLRERPPRGDGLGDGLGDALVLRSAPAAPLAREAREGSASPAAEAAERPSSAQGATGGRGPGTVCNKPWQPPAEAEAAGGGDGDAAGAARPGGGAPRLKDLTKAERRALQEAQRAAKAAAKGGPAGGGKAAAAKGPGGKAAGAAAKGGPGAAAAAEAPGVRRSGSREGLAGKAAEGAVGPGTSGGPGSTAGPAGAAAAGGRSGSVSAAADAPASRAVAAPPPPPRSSELFSHLAPPRRRSEREILARGAASGAPLPAIALGLAFADGSVRGGNARVLALLGCFVEVFSSLQVPRGRSFAKEAGVALNATVAFLVGCRPLSPAMGSAVKHVKAKLEELKLEDKGVGGAPGGRAAAWAPAGAGSAPGGDAGGRAASPAGPGAAASAAAAAIAAGAGAGEAAPPSTPSKLEPYTPAPPPLSPADARARRRLLDTVATYAAEKVVYATRILVHRAAQLIREGGTVLTFGYSSSVAAALDAAAEAGVSFSAAVIDARPLREGRRMAARLRRWPRVQVSYLGLGAVGYALHGADAVLLGAAAVLSNGAVLARVGTAAVAAAAAAAHVPVIVLSETHKFHPRVQLDAVTHNELGDPSEVAEPPGDALGAGAGRRGRRRRAGAAADAGGPGAGVDAPVSSLSSSSAAAAASPSSIAAVSRQPELLNLLYDATPAEDVSMIVTEVGAVPPTSVPVILREYRDIGGVGGV